MLRNRFITRCPLSETRVLTHYRRANIKPISGAFHEAAVFGSALAAYVLGGAFIEGKHGLSRDPAQARYWLEQAVEGKVDDLHQEIEVPELLRALDEAAAEEEEEETDVVPLFVHGPIWSAPFGRPGV